VVGSLIGKGSYMKLSIVILSTVLILFTSFNTRATTQLNATEAYAEMKSLVGQWQKQGSKNSNFVISFELTANDSVLIETWLHKGNKHSLTLYHLNGNSVMATHYCPQGNQPRLQLSPRSTKNNLYFDFLDVTNLTDLSKSHQHSLAFEFSTDSNKVLRKESYLNESGEDNSELVLVRTK